MVAGMVTTPAWAASSNLPSAPMHLTVTPDPAQTSGEIATWEAPTNSGSSPISGYTIAETEDGDNWTFDSVGDVLSAEVSGPVVYVQAVNASGSGSAAVWGTPPPPPRVIWTRGYAVPGRTTSFEFVISGACLDGPPPGFNFNWVVTGPPGVRVVEIADVQPNSTPCGEGAIPFGRAVVLDDNFVNVATARNLRPGAQRLRVSVGQPGSFPPYKTTPIRLVVRPIGAKGGVCPPLRPVDPNLTACLPPGPQRLN